MRRRVLIHALTALAFGRLIQSVAARPAFGQTERRTSMLLSGHSLVGTIWNARLGRATSRDVLQGELRAARYRLIGEVHDNPDHHEFQLECLVALGEYGLRPTVAFEQIDSERESALRRLLAGSGVTAEAVAEATEFNRKSWRWEFYRPLVEAALRYQMPIRAANLSRASAARVVSSGLGALGEGRAAVLRIDSVWSAERERVLRAIIADAHCGMLPEAVVPGMVLAQRARDATLAEALLDPGPDGVVLIAGDGHVRRDLGVPVYLNAVRSGGSIVSVGLLEVEEGKTAPESYLADSAGSEAQYDFVRFTPRADRPDPCEQLKPR